MRFKNLEDKCQYYRGLTDYKLTPNTNILVMLDGKNFSTLIKNNFKKPFDDDFIDMMNKTAQFLCKNVQGVKFAYVQSDEISLLITDYDTPETDTPFGGRLCKLQSILASLATSEFNRQFMLYHLSKDALVERHVILNTVEKMKLAQFDCKVWTVPTQNDVFAWFLYRQLDCIKNSKQQTAQTYISHKRLLGRSADEQIQLALEEKGIDWNAFGNQYKYGRFIKKVAVSCNKQLPSGEEVNFVRNKFIAEPAIDLSESPGREIFFDTVFGELRNESIQR